MRGFSTTYLGMFDTPAGDQPAVSSIEIPIIQRDYAQGREDEATIVIRREFVNVLVRAATGVETAVLDFIYGEVNGGKLSPLDGQQRLTTLFLLHWYVASRAGLLDPEAKWAKFSYATRPSAEFFCRELAKAALPSDTSKPSDWIKDQTWYLFPWRHDPTISAMLVMIDAIDAKFSELSPDFTAVWNRLSDVRAKAISFLLLPISNMRSGDELYIKMNSRGKPLTTFEVFKARLEKALEASPRHKELGEKFDREWSDLLWPYDGGDFAIDDEFMRYVEFIVDVSEWRDGSPRSRSTLEDRAAAVFSSDNPSGQRNLDFFFHAFDTWVGTNPSAEFEQLFARPEESSSRLHLFESKSIDLFGACLNSYGSTFSLTETLILFAVLIFRQSNPTDGDRNNFAARLRSIRNLAESAPDDVRFEFMPALVDATERLALEGSLDRLPRFNQARVEDERLKQDFRTAFPNEAALVDSLEEHQLLRGRLYAFDLYPPSLKKRARLFAAVTAPEHWGRLTGALLSQGDYSRQRSKYHQFGTLNPEKESVWREVFTAGSRDQQKPLRDSLRALLDHPVLEEFDDIGSALDEISSEFCRQREAESEPNFDWRYYLVKYPIMRSGASGAYVAESFDDGVTRALGYSLCILNTTTLGGYFRDPYLAAMREISGVGDKATDPRYIDRFEWHERWMELPSGVAMRCVSKGIELRAPASQLAQNTYRGVCERFQVRDDFLGVPQSLREQVETDTVDRVALGADLLRAFVEAGL